MGLNIKIINHSGSRIISSNFLRMQVLHIFRNLKNRKVYSPQSNERLTIAFVTEVHIRQLNLKLRKKNKVTDVLSFHDEENGIGELALCPSYIKTKSKKYSMSVREYTVYMVLHGILHLLGFEHEGKPKEAQKMFRLQDSIFESLKKKF